MPLWELDAKQCIDQHALAMYPLLPTMQGANADLIVGAINEMARVYTGDDLSRRLSWLDTLLKRADVMSDIEKLKVEEFMDTFDELLEENPRIRKIVDRATAKKVASLAADVTAQVTERVSAQVRARVIGQIKTEAETEVMQNAVLELIQARFPHLVRFAREKVSQINEPSVLHTLIARLSVAPDEEAVRDILISSVP